MEIVKKWVLLIFLYLHGTTWAANDLSALKLAYPDMIKDISNHYIAWNDGSKMLVSSNIPFIDHLYGEHYKVDFAQGSISKQDIANDSYEPFFRKMYGNSAKEVEKKLVTIYWMSHIYGKKYPLRVTTVNGVDKRLQRVSDELEKLPPEFHKYVIKPASSFYWRNVSHEKYLSFHSFGVAIDINLAYSNYWLWDWVLAKKNKRKLGYQNHIPKEIVEIFEKQGFFWGGRWYHYDTMHFEYRPEFFV